MFDSQQLVRYCAGNVAGKVAGWVEDVSVQLWHREALVSGEWVQTGGAESGRELYENSREENVI